LRFTGRTVFTFGLPFELELDGVLEKSLRKSIGFVFGYTFNGELEVGHATSEQIPKVLPIAIFTNPI
jgi:hypothetical protein